MSAPVELGLYWRCQNHNSLPGPGGVDEQEEGLMRRMVTMASVYDAVRAYLDARAPEAAPVPRRGRSSAPQENRLMRWYNNPRNAQQVRIVNALFAKGVISKQGKLL